jgi:hypothetical protein
MDARVLRRNSVGLCCLAAWMLIPAGANGLYSAYQRSREVPPEVASQEMGGECIVADRLIINYTCAAFGTNTCSWSGGSCIGSCAFSCPTTFAPIYGDPLIVLQDSPNEDCPTAAAKLTCTLGFFVCYCAAPSIPEPSCANTTHTSYIAQGVCH